MYLIKFAQLGNFIKLLNSLWNFKLDNEITNTHIFLSNVRNRKLITQCRGFLKFIKKKNSSGSLLTTAY